MDTFYGSLSPSVSVGSTVFKNDTNPVFYHYVIVIYSLTLVNWYKVQLKIGIY